MINSITKKHQFVNLIYMLTLFSQAFLFRHILYKEREMFSSVSPVTLIKTTHYICALAKKGRNFRIIYLFSKGNQHSPVWGLSHAGCLFVMGSFFNTVLYFISPSAQLIWRVAPSLTQYATCVAGSDLILKVSMNLFSKCYRSSYEQCICACFFFYVLTS